LIRATGTDSIRIMNLTDAQIEALTERLHNLPVVCAAFLHGSAAKNRLRADSDVDVALLLNTRAQMPADVRLRLAGELEAIFGRTADIGILSTNNLIYAKEVVEHGRILFTKNPFFSEQFLSTCLALYADLQEERKEVFYAYSA
jgi:predicted nucleotidyltransferase